MMTRLWGQLSALGLNIAAFTFAVDQAVKYWLLYSVNMPARQQITLAPFFDVVMAWNRGVSYGLLTTENQNLLIAMSLLIVSVLWFWLCRTRRPLTAASIGLVLGGALSNAFDRWVHGAVADFFLFHYHNFNWYVFNPADMAIFAGVVLLLYESFVERKSESRP